MIDDGDDELNEVARLLALGPSDVAEERPPADLWAGIEAALLAEEGPDVAPPSPPPLPDVGRTAPGERDELDDVDELDVADAPYYADAPHGADATHYADEPYDADATHYADAPHGADATHYADEPHDAEAPVVSLADERRARRGLPAALIAAVAAAIVLVALPLALAFQSSGSDPVDGPMADLVAIEDFDGSGVAELEGRELRVETLGLDEIEGSDYELWLLDFDDGELVDLVSLGIIDADGSFAIADDVDLDEFDVVDISREPLDGDPTHSGDSVLRGELMS